VVRGVEPEGGRRGDKLRDRDEVVAPSPRTSEQQQALRENLHRQGFQILAM
jgi:hypothetical protein